VNRDQVLLKLEKAWNSFRESYAGLGAEQMSLRGAVEDWSVKDLIAHVSWWEEESLKHLPHILEGKRPPRYSVLYGGIDAFNAKMTELKRSLSLDEVMRQAVETHGRLVNYLAGVPEDVFMRETRFRRRLRLDTYSHYPIHTAAIRAWREKPSRK